MTAQEQSKHFTAVKTIQHNGLRPPIRFAMLQGYPLLLISWSISVDMTTIVAQIQNVAFDTAVPHSYEAFFVKKKKREMTTALHYYVYQCLF